MLILPGPAKVDLIFPDEPHTKEPPWERDAGNLNGDRGAFWDWMLWLRGKEERRKTELIENELEELFNHLLRPLGVARRPSSIAESIALYRTVRDQAESRLGVVVPREVEEAVSPACSDFGRA